MADEPTDLRGLTERLARAARPQVENLCLHQRIDSTQASALRLVARAENEELVLPPTLVVALEQHRGRGRSGRSWRSPEGGLYMSWLARGLHARTLSLLPMLAAATVLEAVRHIGVRGASIKWPNDIEVDGRKLAGLLIHARHGEASWAVVGVGVNLARTPKLADRRGRRPVSVADLIGPGDAADRAEELIRAFTGGLDHGIRSPAGHVTRWREGLRHRLREAMTVRLADGAEIRGRFAGVTDEGHLRLDVDGTERVVWTGDVVE